MRIWKFALLSCCVLMLVAPLVFHVMGWSAVESRENRNLAQWPRSPEGLNDFRDYPRQLDAYLEDHFGLRDFLVDTYGAIRYHFLRKASKDHVLVGRDGFLFLAKNPGELAPKKLWRSCGVAQEDPEPAQQAMREAKRYFDARNLSLTYMFVPTKAAIYPDKLPAGLRDQCGDARKPVAAQLAEFGRQLQVPALYPRSELEALRKRAIAYYPAQYHWHAEAPLMAAGLVAAELGRGPLGVAEPPKEQRQHTPDLARHLPGVDLVFDFTAYRYGDAAIDRCSGEKCIPGAGEKYGRGLKLNVFTNVAPNNVAPKNELLVLSDSFGWQIAAPLALYFSEVTIIDTNQLNSKNGHDFFEWVLGETEPDTVLLLYSDGGLPNRLERDWRLFSGS